MLARALAYAVVGLDGGIVKFEVNIVQRVTERTIVGLPDASVQEAREWARPSTRNSGCSFPLKLLTVNRAPVDVRKEGQPVHGLQIATGIRSGSKQTPPLPDHMVFLGGLALHHSVSPAGGIPPIVAYARALRVDCAFLCRPRMPPRRRLCGSGR